MASMQMAFASAGPARRAELRSDPTHLARLLDSPDARVLPVWRGKPQMRLNKGDVRLGWVGPDDAVLSHAPRPFTFLGEQDGHPLFAADLSDWEPDALDRSALAMFHDKSLQHYPGTDPALAFADLRVNLMTLAPVDATLAATARALFNWHQRHGFCAACGQPSQIAMAGWERQCPACGARHFPRTDPVVIMLVTHGNSTLMGRSPGWPEGMFSALAGFIEPGESVETAVAREVHEETGIMVDQISYVASQPWPFPSSLMIGCRAVAQDTRIMLDDELEDARWFTREEVLSVRAGERPDLMLARPGSIAYGLISLWLEGRI